MHTRMRVLAAGIIGSALIAAIPCEARTIYGCRKTPGGALRIVGGAGRCTSFEREISWNSVGPQGPAGPVGPQGPAGESCQSFQPQFWVCGGCSLPGIFMGAQQLQHAYLRAADLTQADFSGSNLSNANFDAATLSGTWFSAAVLVGARFAGAHGNPRLSQANLSYAIFEDANLADQSWGTDFSDANLDGAVFVNSNLQYSMGLDTAILTNVTWTNTTCPDGTNSSTNGSTPESCEGHLTPP